MHGLPIHSLAAGARMKLDSHVSEGRNSDLERGFIMGVWVTEISQLAPGARPGDDFG